MDVELNSPPTNKSKINSQYLFIFVYLMIYLLEFDKTNFDTFPLTPDNVSNGNN